MIEIIKQYILLDNGADLLRRLLLGTGIFLAIYFVGKIISKRIEKKVLENNINQDTYAIKISKHVGSIVMIAFIIFDILSVFQIVGFDVAILMGGMSLGLGFAMENMISNMISGIIILTNKKINIGDYVEFFGKLNLKGTVEEINIRYSIIRTFDKRRIVVPNNMIAKSAMKTFKIEPLIRGEINLSLPRNIDFEQVKGLVVGAINNIDGVLHKEFTTLFINGFDSHGINTKAFFFSCPQKGKGPFKIKKALWVSLLDIFRKYGINIPHDHMTITFEDN